MTTKEYYNRAVELSGKNFTMEESLSGYWRLLLDEDIVLDDSACEDVYNEENAMAMFADYIYENYTNAQWKGYRYV